jgi:esterase/lipase superfamily enzyme
MYDLKLVDLENLATFVNEHRKIEGRVFFLRPGRVHQDMIAFSGVHDNLIAAYDYYLENLATFENEHRKIEGRVFFLRPGRLHQDMIAFSDVHDNLIAAYDYYRDQVFFYDTQAKHISSMYWQPY